MRSFVLIDDASRTFAVPADRVTWIVPEAEWAGESPRYLSAALSKGADDVERRVLVTRTRTGNAAIMGSGRVDVIDVADDELLILPPIFFSGEDCPFVSHVVFRDGSVPILVVDIDAFVGDA